MISGGILVNAIDLFAGCGGLSKGFMDAGFEIIVGVDNDQAALNTFVLVLFRVRISSK